MNKQVKSKERVSKHGEVFTSEKDVNAMLDLVKNETLRVDSRFLEPACGDGNFLAEILKRKLAVAKKNAIPPRRKKPELLEYEKQSFIAISSLYGVDLLIDNVESCRARLYKLWKDAFEKNFDKECSESCQKSVRFVLSKNIVCGNALSLKQVDENGKDTCLPIVFSEWSFVTRDKVQRKDFRYDRLLSGEYSPKATLKNTNEEIELDLFNFNENTEAELNDCNDGELINTVISDFRNIQNYE